MTIASINSLLVSFFGELLTNKKLFTGKNYVEVLKKIDVCDIPLPRFYNSEVDHDLQEIVLKMLPQITENVSLI